MQYKYMKLLASLLFVWTIGLAYGQSTRKIHAELKKALDLEVQKADATQMLLTELNQKIDSCLKSLETNDKTMKCDYKTLEIHLQAVKSNVNKVNSLGVSLEWTEKNQITQLYEQLNLYHSGIAKTLSTLKQSKNHTFPTSAMNPEVSKEEQANWMKKTIAEFKTAETITKENIELKKVIFTTLEHYLEQLDSLQPLTRDAAIKTMSKDKELNIILDSLKSHYSKNGPKGFPEQYAKIFPSVHPAILQKPHTILEKETDDPGAICSVPVQSSKVDPVYSDDNIFLIAEEDADFPGGRKALLQFLAENLNCPAQIHCSLEGKTTLRFVVTKEGEIKDIKVLRKLPGCSECDQEAIRVIQSMPKWIPGKNGGKPVNSYFDLPIAFK